MEINLHYPPVYVHNNIYMTDSYGAQHGRRFNSNTISPMWPQVMNSTFRCFDFLTQIHGNPWDSLKYCVKLSEELNRT